MKKILILLVCFVAFTQIKASRVNDVSPVINTYAYENSLFFRVSMSVTSYDNCGQKLSFTISCSSCSFGELGAAADNFIFDHTNSSGCYFL